MAINHDYLASKVGEAIVQKILSNNNWKQVFSDNLSKIGDFSWPRPDYILYDFNLSQSLAFEFKPPNHSKREYLTGLGQTISYLTKHHYSGIILPNEIEGFKIAEFISQILELDVFDKNFVSVVGYDEKLLESDPINSITLHKKINDIRTGEIINKNLSERYWAWWRDISHFEIFDMLELLDQFRDHSGDIYSNYVWDIFWEKLIEGKTKQWDGSPRQKNDSSKNSEKQNYKIPLFHLNLIEQSEGRITKEGYELLSIGKLYGVESSIFIDYLSKIVLDEGKHLLLIKDLNHYTENASQTQLKDQASYRIGFEEYLVKKNAVGTRKPGRTTTGNKLSYIRDEFKLWNKLNFLKRKTQNQYFFVDEGIKFNWSRITDLLTKDF